MRLECGKYRYYDKEKKYLFAYQITGNDYNRVLAGGMGYKCNETSYSKIVKNYQSELPCEYLDGCLFDIRHDTSLYLYIRGNYDSDRVTYKYLKYQVETNWDDLRDLLMEFAIMNNEDIVFHFYTISGKAVNSVILSSNFYNNN